MGDKLQEAINRKAGTDTLKMKELVGARNWLNTLANTQPKQAATSIRLARLARGATVELESYDEQKIKLARSLGETDDGQNFRFPDRAKREEWEAQIEALGDEEVTLPAVRLKAEDFDPAPLPACMAALYWLFPELSGEGDAEATAEAAPQS